MQVNMVSVEQPSVQDLPAKSVVLVHRGSDGTVARVVVADKSKGRKKVDRRLKPLDKALRKVTRARRIAADEYLRRHDRSNSKKKNGAIKELPKNVGKASRKGLRSL